MPFLHSLKLLFQQENLPRSIFVDRILFVIGIVGTPIELYVASMNGQVDWFSFGLRCVIFTLCLFSLIFSFVTERGKANSARMSMIYLIGGAPRTGKSLLGQQVAVTLKSSWLSTDVLQALLHVKDAEEANAAWNAAPTAITAKAESFFRCLHPS